MSQETIRAFDFPGDGFIFDPPMQVHHLTGGLSLMIGSNRLAVLMSPGGPGMIFFSLNKKAPVSSRLQGQNGVRPLGRNHFSIGEEMNESITSNFAIAATGANNQCLAHHQEQTWSGLATALHNERRGANALQAARVASQIRLCLSRLERLSAAYRTALMAAAKKEKSASNRTFVSDKYAQHLGAEYRSVLNELYSLRDALLIAAYRLHLSRGDSFTMKKARQALTAERSQVAALFCYSMFSDEGDHLIDHMSLYRNVAQHCLGATNPVFGDVYTIRNSNGPFGQIPYLVYPLYDDISAMRAIESGSSKGVLERPPTEEVVRFARLSEHRDALEFSYDCFERLLRIAEVLQKEIGIEPQVTVITEKDILEITITDKDGRITRAKKDDVTGKLVEY